jgi:hypothetical protein
MSEEFICYVPRNICLADLDHHFGKIRLGVSRRLGIRWGNAGWPVALEGGVPKPKGYKVITLSDQIYCGGRIYEGQGWRLLQSFKAGQARQFRDMVERTLLLVTASGQGIMAFS